MVRAAAAGAEAFTSAGMAGPGLRAAPMLPLGLALCPGILSPFEFGSPASPAAQRDPFPSVLSGLVLGKSAGNVAFDPVVGIGHSKTP